MKIQILSDLHLEFFGPNDDIMSFLASLNTDADCIIMAGDIFGYKNLEMQMKHVAKAFNDKEIIFVPGNHEYYHTSKYDMDSQMHIEAKKHGIILLEDGYHMLSDNYIVIGACGWHDSFVLNNTRLMNDFNHIDELRSDPYESVKWNRESKLFFTNTLDRFRDKKAICVTHNSPLANHTPYKYMGSSLNPFFVNNWSDIIERYKPQVWISGHLHQHIEFKMFETFFIENGYGYYNYDIAKHFDKNLTIELA